MLYKTEIILATAAMDSLLSLVNLILTMAITSTVYGEI